MAFGGFNVAILVAMEGVMMGLLAAVLLEVVLLEFVLLLVFVFFASANEEDVRYLRQARAKEPNSGRI